MNFTVHPVENSSTPSTALEGNVKRLPPPALRQDLRRRVASALGIKPHLVQIAGHRELSSELLLRCWGRAAQTRFFAKVYLADPYPVIPRFATPSEELACPGKPHRSLDEQISADVNMAQEMRRIVGTRNIPAPLGLSIVERIVVYEEVDGLRLDHLANTGWPPTRHRAAVKAALFQAGNWLRRLHTTSCEGYETLQLDEITGGLSELMRGRGMEKTRYTALALTALESARRALRPESSARFPVALNHGDFSLPNLIWDGPPQHLWVLDFELSTRRTILHDLGMMAFELKRLLLHPLASRGTIGQWEDAFWAGYGEVSRPLFAFVNALAAARIFYHLFPKLLTWRKTRGLWAGTKASIYTGIFEPVIVRRILRIPRHSMTATVVAPVYSNSEIAAHRFD